MGPKKRNARLRLYAFMMSGFSEEQKIQSTAKIVQDLLAHAVDYFAAKNRYYHRDTETEIDSD
jgi:hypothetical protein